MATFKILTPKELLAMTLTAAQKAPATTGGGTVVPTNTPIVNPTAAQQTIINQQTAAAQKAGVVTPTTLVDLPGSGGEYDKAMLAAIFGTSGTPSVYVPPATAASTPVPAYTPPAYTAPVYTPINVAPAAYTAPDTTPPAYTAPAYTPINVPVAAYTEPDTTAPAYTAPAYKDIAIPTPAYTDPAASPIMDAANAAFAEYQKSATGAANNVLDAQMAQANSLINGGGIWATLQPTAQKQMDDSVAALTQISTVAKANVESSRVALNAQDAANYAMVIDTLDKAVVASRQQTTEQMNQRGMFFSTVLDAVMGEVNAAYTTQKGQAAQQDKASLAKIASDMAVMSGNIDIETIKGNASAVAQYTAEMLSVTAQDAQTKQTAQALLASLNTQKAGVVDAVAAQVFATGQQMKATAFGQQSQLNADAANAANTKFSQENQLSSNAFNQQVQQNTDAANAAIAKFGQQVQINLDKANAQATTFNQQGQLSTMAFNQQVQQNNDAANASIAKFSQQAQLNLDAANAQITSFNQQGQLSTQAFNQQVQQNNDAANASITAFNQQAQLRGEATNAADTLFNQNQQTYANTTNAANTTFTQNLQTNAATADATTTAQNEFIATMGQYAGDYQAAANKLDPNDPLYAFKEGMLESAHNQKAIATTQAQATAILEAAKAKAAAEQQTFDNVQATAKTNTAIAAQQATAAYQRGQINNTQYSNLTGRINSGISQQNANTSQHNAYKTTAGTAGGAAGGSLTYTQAMGNIDDYTKLQTTLGTLHQGADGKWYGSAANTNQIANAQGVVLPTVDVLVDVTTLKRQIAELEPAYRASIAVRDKTSGTTTPLPLDATEKANVNGFLNKVSSITGNYGGVDVKAYAQQYLKAVQSSGTPLNQKEVDAINSFYNGG